MAIGFPQGFGGFSFLPLPNQVQPNAAPVPQANGSAAPALPAPQSGISPAFLNTLGQVGAGEGFEVGGHVTANPTNTTVAAPNQSLASSPFGFGFPAATAVAGFVPVLVLAPVALPFGLPVFQGSPAQPPVAAPEQPVEDAIVVEDVPEQVPEVTEPVAEAEETPVAEVPTTLEAPEAPETVDVVPPAPAEEQAPVGPQLPIEGLNAEDFARFRLRERSLQQETQLNLQLTTAEGDVVTLDFSQIDASEELRFRGTTNDGERFGDEQFTEDSERVVNAEVSGDISESERAAIDSVVSAIVDAANTFLTGEVGAAVEQLRALDFDTSQLSELSLNISLSRNADLTRAYQNVDESVADLVERDANIGQALEFIATEQRRLVDLARDSFDTPSAARLVRSLVPPLLSEPFAELRSRLNEAESAVSEEV